MHAKCIYISIHALRVEGDAVFILYLGGFCKYFYPRPPGGGRHIQRYRELRNEMISIHALRVEGDCRDANESHYLQRDFYPRPPGGGRPEAEAEVVPFFHFYPRPPGGGRRLQHAFCRQSARFLSTPSGWRATIAARPKARGHPISIHALRVEGDNLARLRN